MASSVLVVAVSHEDEAVVLVVVVMQGLWQSPPSFSGLRTAVVHFTVVAPVLYGLKRALLRACLSEPGLDRLSRGDGDFSGVVVVVVVCCWCWTGECGLSLDVLCKKVGSSSVGIVPSTPTSASSSSSSSLANESGLLATESDEEVVCVEGTSSSSSSSPPVGERSMGGVIEGDSGRA